MTDATLLHHGPRPAVRLERTLMDSPEAVWRAITDREQLSSWFPTEVVVAGGRWSAGAKIDFHFPAGLPEANATGEVLDVNEPNRLAFTWGEDTLQFELSAHGDGTRLVLTDELPHDTAARNAAGWDRCLDRLAGLEPETDWQELFERYATAFEPTLGPQSGLPDSHDNPTT